MMERQKKFFLFEKRIFSDFKRFIRPEPVLPNHLADESCAC